MATAQVLTTAASASAHQRREKYAHQELTGDVGGGGGGGGIGSGLLLLLPPGKQMTAAALVIKDDKKKEATTTPVGRMMRGQQQHHETGGGAPLKGLKRYKILSLIGDGTYGLVYLALNSETREKVAIKTMKRRYHSWDEVMELREVKSLKKLHHPNVVKLKEVIRENSRLYFVFEYIKGDLLGLMRERSDPFPETWIRSVVFQLLQGLSYMHRLGFFHRDLKPENILASGPDVVKIADFGLAREIRSAPPFTDYVSTRWYRAPEVLLRSTSYNSPIDVWAVGCITCELYTKRPLFPGTSEIDQLYKICSILGSPGRGDWQEGFTLAGAMSFRFPTFSPTHLSQVLGSRSSARTVSFLYTLLTWNPAWRSSAQEGLKHAYFRGPRGSAGDAAAGQNKLDEVAGSALSISQKRSMNGAIAHAGVAAHVGHGSDEDFEQLRETLRNKNKGGAAVAASKSMEDVNQHDGQHNRANGGVGIPASHSHHELDRDEDLSDLISAFGLSPDAGRQRQNVPIKQAPPAAAAPPFDRSTSVRRRQVSRESSIDEGRGGGGNTLKDKLPRFSNLDPVDKVNHGRPRLLQLQRNSSVEDRNGTSLFGGGGGAPPLAPQTSAIAAAVPRVSFAGGGPTKYSALYRGAAANQHGSVDGGSVVAVNSGLITGAPAHPVPVYAAAASSVKDGQYVPSFGGGHYRAATGNGGLPPNGIVANGLQQHNGFAPGTTAGHHQQQSQHKTVTFSTNKALAATSPLYADKVSPQHNKFYSPFRSLPDFSVAGGGVDKQGVSSLSHGSNGAPGAVVPHSNSFTLVGNGHAGGKAVEKQPPQQKQKVHVRTNWAAKYLH